MYLIEGLFLGFASILLVGPVVFILINACEKGGRKSGIAVALGIIVGDIIYAVAVYKSIDFILSNPIFNIIVSYLGFIALFGLGILYLFKKHKSFVSENKKIEKNLISNFLQGFSINFFNPFVLSVWLVVVNYAKNSHSNESVSFIAASLLGIFLIDLFKVYLSKKLLKYISSNKLKLFYKFSGLIMIGFSLRILYFIYTNNVGF